MNWKWTFVICLFGVSLGVIHGMDHFEFYRFYTQLLNDVDRLVELLSDYVTLAIVKLGFSKDSKKLLEVVKHYELMVHRAQPLFALFKRDFQQLLLLLDHLESIQILKKFLYIYFRQSAIHLVAHLKREYDFY